MIERILILCISEIPEDVLGVIRILAQVEQLVEAQLLDKPFFILLRDLHFNLVVEVQIFVLLLLVVGV